MKANKLAIGSDHAGFECKEDLILWLQARGFEVNDFGTYSTESVDYADFIHPVADAVENGEADLGIIICGSGNGAAITANKHQGIRAALCWSEEIARLGRSHNNANVLSIPARFVSAEEARAIAGAFLATEFEGGRHERRIQKIPLGC
ncbi:MAG: ribose 5-phosphate isomerase B [Haliscomenobacter sp.]|nr:ribose 5-phosphate isomerase B [Haliscomenobacter sp.]MBK8879763.1 ribose 5-phosphate isomerase B [Haliscomenobacter sp.]